MEFGRSKSKFQEVPETGVTFVDVAVSVCLCCRLGSGLCWAAGDTGESASACGLGASDTICYTVQPHSASADVAAPPPSGEESPARRCTQVC